MPRAVLHLELPGIHAAAAVELGHARPDEEVVVHHEERVVDVVGVPLLRPGQPLRLARQWAPQAVLVPVGVLAGAETYRAVWDRLMEVGPRLEPTAWHAGYVDVTGCLPRRGPKVYLAGLAKRLATLTGQLPSQGVGGSKLVARHASPAGEIVTADETLRFLHGQRLRPDQGLTVPMIQQLDELGCHRWGDVAEVPEPRLRALFGVGGTILHRWSQGIDPRLVQARYPPPSETVSAAVEPDEHGLWLAGFEPLCQTLAQRLQRRGEVATEISLGLGGREGWRAFRRRLARGIDGAERIRAVVIGLIPADLDPWSVDELRLTLRGLRLRESVQGVLFEDEEEERGHLLSDALTRVRERYGLGSLGYGHELLASRERLAEAVWRLEGVWA